MHRAFGTNSGSAGNVIDGVAHQPEQVNDLICRHAELFLDPGFVAPFDRRHRLFALDHLRVLPHTDDQRVAHKLAHVLVIRDDNSIQISFGGLDGERADHVVSFETGHADDRNVVGFAEAFYVRHLGREIVRHLQPRGFVIGEGFVTKSFFLGLVYCRDVFRLLILQELSQHVGEDVDGLRDLAFRSGQRRGAIRHRRIERTENV